MVAAARWARTGCSPVATSQGPSSFPKSEAAAKRVLSLPMHGFLDDATQDRIVDAIRAAV